MSRIEELIKEKCPNGVKYYKLSEICEKFTGLSGKSKADFQTGNYRYITYINIYNNPSVNLYTNDFVRIKPNEKQNIIKFKDILIAGSSENLEDSGMISVVTSVPNEKIYLNSFCFGLRLTKKYFDLYNANFLKHLFRSKKIRSEIIKCSFGVTRYNLSKDKLLKIKIPCPSIEVQEEIVRILDKFIELKAELEAELEARKKQYEFWRGKLLNSDINIKRLGDIAIFSQGLQVEPEKQFETKLDGMVQFLRIVDFVKNDEKPRYINKPNDKYMKHENTDLVMIRYGASAAGKVFFNKSGAIANNMFKINLITNIVNIKYVWYYLSQNSVYKWLNNIGSGSTMPAINFRMVSAIEIPIPPLKEQQKIVNILDKFNKIIDGISDGLPAEIELRKKQYEYYRDRLLSFEKLEGE